MLGTYAAAALICVASLWVGRAVLLLAGSGVWTWLEPMVGFGILLTLAGATAWIWRNPPATGAVLVAATAAAGLTGAPRPGCAAAVGRRGLWILAILGVTLAVPLAVGHWTLAGADPFDLHLAQVEWLQGAGVPSPAARNALGPAALASALAVLPGIDAERALLGELVAIVLLSGLTAVAAIDHLRSASQVLAAVLVALPYLVASFLLMGALRPLIEAMVVLWTGVALLRVERRIAIRPGSGHGLGASWRVALPALAVAGAAFFSNSVAGLVWPIAITVRWSLNRPAVRRAVRLRALPQLLHRRAVWLGVALVGGLALLATVVPFSVALEGAGATTAPISPAAGLGFWPFDGFGPRTSAGALVILGIDVATIGIALLWWLRRREAAVPVAFGVSLVIYLLQPFFAADYARAQALAILAPVAMLVVARPLLEELSSVPTPLRRGRPLLRSGDRRGFQRTAWAALAVAFFGAAVWSTVAAF